MRDSQKLPKIGVIILTKDEQQHIARSIRSVESFAAAIYVVDSGSSDNTVEIATSNGAFVFSNKWINYATQFNWGIQQVESDIDWVLRLDADEVVTEELGNEITRKLQSVPTNVDGIIVNRRMCFLGQPIKWGGVFPTKMLRLFRNGRGKCENRWMDEHIIVPGATMEFGGEIVDNNLKSLSWWTDKHNGYASREVVDILNHEFNFMNSETIADREGGQAGFKRWTKEEVYSRLPGGTRALFYFLYRYCFRLGVLDGRRGAIFHFLQGFWYRYLVDAKLYEVRKYMSETGSSPVQAVLDVLSIDVQGTENSS